jgi:kynurenine formamidase
LLPLKDLIAPCRVINITSKCELDRNYSLTPEDILSHEFSSKSPLSPGEIVLVHTGWSRHYSSGPSAYLGCDELSFPGIGPEASELLVSRGVAAVGIDTASLDPGTRRDFLAHRLLLGAGIYGIENLNEGVGRLPPVGATLIVMPLKIEGGSGAPTRVVAICPCEQPDHLTVR